MCSGVGASSVQSKFSHKTNEQATCIVDDDRREHLLFLTTHSAPLSHTLNNTSHQFISRICDMHIIQPNQ